MTKSKFLTPLLLLGGAVLIYVAAKASQFVNGLKITFSNISLGGSLSQPEAIATLKIFNPTNTSITMDSLSGILLYKGKKIADVESVNNVIINEQSNVYLDLRIISTFSDVFQLIKQLLNKQISNDFAFDGSITIAGVSLPYKTNLSW